MFDSTNKIRVINRRVCEIFKINYDAVCIGLPYSALIELAAVAAGLLGRKGAGDLLRIFHQKPESSAAADPAAYPVEVVELNDRRLVALVQRRLPDGGRVMTFEDVTQSRRAQDRVVFLARHDAMTGLPNRVQLAESALARLESSESFALLCLDLDRFKEVNDTFGHHCGDELLRQVGNRLRSCARQVDAVSRLGGDEFAFILGGVRDRGEAARAAKRIVDYLGETYELEGRHVSIGVSIGIALAPEHGVEFEALLRRADAALYASKKSERGSWRVFDDQIERDLQSRRVMEIELRAALGNGELEVVYQPICDLQTGKVSAFEALLRWNHPSRGRIAPGDFIALCEEAGLIGPIGEWVLKTASLQATQWPDDVQVAVNVSPVQFMDPGFVQTVQSALTATGLAPARLELEITRIRADEQQRQGAAEHRRHPQPRRADLSGRFRHRLLLAELSAQVQVRQNQDRPKLHPRPQSPARFECHRQDDHRPDPGHRRAHDG